MHAFRTDHNYKKIKKISAKCLICGEHSECKIMKYEVVTYRFFIRDKTTDEQFYFDWKKCRHRVVITDSQDVARYQQEYIDIENYSVPYYKNMHMGNMPKKVPWIHIVLVLILTAILGYLVALFVEYIKNKLGIPFLI
jgi:hypothetical protein